MNNIAKITMKDTGVTYGLEAVTAQARCTTGSSLRVKTITMLGDYEIIEGMIIDVSFEYGNDYGDGVTTYPTVSLNAFYSDMPLRDSRGNYAKAGDWKALDKLVLLIRNDGAYILNSVVGIASDTISEIDQSSKCPVDSKAVIDFCKQFRKIATYKIDTDVDLNDLIAEGCYSCNYITSLNHCPAGDDVEPIGTVIVDVSKEYILQTIVTINCMYTRTRYKNSSGATVWSDWTYYIDKTRLAAAVDAHTTIKIEKMENVDICIPAKSSKVGFFNLVQGFSSDNGLPVTIASAKEIFVRCEKFADNKLMQTIQTGPGDMYIRFNDGTGWSGWKTVLIAESDINTLLSKYLTTEAYNNNIKNYVKQDTLNSYLTKTSAADTYVKQSNMQNYLANYVTLEALKDYATKTYVADAIAANNTDNIATTYATRAQMETGLSNVYDKAQTDDKFATKKSLNAYTPTEDADLKYASKNDIVTSAEATLEAVGNHFIPNTKEDSFAKAQDVYSKTEVDTKLGEYTKTGDIEETVEQSIAATLSIELAGSVIPVMEAAKTSAGVITFGNNAADNPDKRYTKYNYIVVKSASEGVEAQKCPAVVYMTPTDNPTVTYYANYHWDTVYNKQGYFSPWMQVSAGKIHTEVTKFADYSDRGSVNRWFKVAQVVFGDSNIADFDLTLSIINDRYGSDPYVKAYTQLHVTAPLILQGAEGVSIKPVFSNTYGFDMSGSLPTFRISCGHYEFFRKDIYKTTGVNNSYPVYVSVEVLFGSEMIDTTNDSYQCVCISNNDCTSVPVDVKYDDETYLRWFPYSLPFASGTDGIMYLREQKYLVAETTHLSGDVPTSRKVNGHALSDDVTVTKSDVGLGNVANTGDSATPVSGGTTKFTTGGAYTELAKKQDKLTFDTTPTASSTNPVTSGGVKTALDGKVGTGRKVNGHALSADVTVTKSDVGLGNVANTGDSATPVSGGTTKFTTGGAYTELAKKNDKITITDDSSAVLTDDSRFVTANGSGTYPYTNHTSFLARKLSQIWTYIKGKADSTYVPQTRTVNGHALSANVSVTKSDVGLGNVANTGDSATPVSGGTTKFTTGGAYTELAKKNDKITITDDSKAIISTDTISTFTAQASVRRFTVSKLYDYIKETLAPSFYLKSDTVAKAYGDEEGNTIIKNYVQSDGMQRLKIRPISENDWANIVVKDNYTIYLVYSKE